MLQVNIWDSHRCMTPKTLIQEAGETERAFERRAYQEYLAACHKWDGYKGSGNTVYMSLPRRQGDVK